ncbi:hypothetical protein DL240_09650 [Lujinxingia litoralis]|uniref:Co-chaperone DjlA N-terminal domain-containing protein n=1 Tax=Lujinxingia litoralis TaxID=2211119 RepID=A0A328C4C3_9DELT|nr:TerB family tellurite resistance protein [Lujinxingia litoralis]RAL22109.1 hypothetical protein DL240_09650 [Lujinxingia litoralis]
MPIFQMIANKLTERRFGKLTQEQNEALIETLVATKVIDGKIMPEEERELVEAIGMLKWQGAFEADTFVQNAVAGARSLEPTPAVLAELFGALGARLGDDWLREEAYYLSSLVALSDQEVHEDERVLLQQMVQSFGISAEKQSLIIRKITREEAF